MLAPVSLLTTIKNECETTYYFFSKETGMLLSLEVDINQVTVLNDQLLIDKVLAAYNLHVYCIEIYEYLDGTYYFYLGVKNDSEVREINISQTEFFKILQTYNPLIYIETHVLSKCGMYLTKELLLNSLENVNT